MHRYFFYTQQLLIKRFSNQRFWNLFICVNTLRPRQDGRNFTDDIFKCISLDENVWIPINISLKFVPKGPVNNIPTLVQIIAWRRPGDKPLSEAMMVILPTYICVTRPQWVKVCQKSEYFRWSIPDIKRPRAPFINIDYLSSQLE